MTTVREQRIKRDIQALTGLDESAQLEVAVQHAYAYLEREVLKLSQRSVLCRNRCFWRWWLREWAIRDELLIDALAAHAGEWIVGMIRSPKDRELVGFASRHRLDGLYQHMPPGLTCRSIRIYLGSYAFAADEEGELAPQLSYIQLPDHLR
jgi:hypothetical protein